MVISKPQTTFFHPNIFTQGILYISQQAGLSSENFSHQAYTKTTRLRHEHFILEFYGFKRFDQPATEMITQEISNMARSELKPKLIFWQCIELMIRKKLQIPNYSLLTGLILFVLNQRKRDLELLIKEVLTSETKSLLDDLFIQNPHEDNQSTLSKTARYKLTLLKKLSQSTRPTKVKESVADFQLLEDLYQKLNQVLSVLNLGHLGIRYYAGSVIKSEIFQLTRRTDEDRYIHVTAFIAH